MRKRLVLAPANRWTSTGAPLSVELGPGLIESIFDGIQRPLTTIICSERATTSRAAWTCRVAGSRQEVELQGARAKTGDNVTGRRHNWRGAGNVGRGAPHHGARRNYEGEIVAMRSPDPTRLDETVATSSETEKGGTVNLTMLQRWPVRRGRPYKEKLAPDQPMVTGQRVIDTFFPIARGGVAAVPGPFGSGQDRGAASAGKVGGRGHHRLRRLRRARQRDDRRADGVPGAARPAHRRKPDEAHRADRQHLGHACGGARSVHLHRHHHRRVLPRYGLQGGHYGRLHVAAGPRRCAKCPAVWRKCPAKKAIPPTWPAAWREFYERAGWVECLGERRPHGRDLRHRRGIPARRRYFRARNARPRCAS